MKILSACFSGPRASKMPYLETSKEHEKLENVLKAEIARLIWEGVSEFYVGGQTGIDTLAALLVMNIKEEFRTTANINLVVPYKGMENSFTVLQKENFEWIKQSAKTVIYMNDKYTKNCYRERNQYMVDGSDYLGAVMMEDEIHSGTQMTINMARKKKREIIILNLVTLEIEYENNNVNLRLFKGNGVV